MNAPLPAGAGAMLARLVGLGRRCGLQPEAVLLHVLDGAPLPEAENELLRNIAEEMAGRPEHERPDASRDALIRKGDRAIHLYGTTALSNPAIGRLVESTPQTVSWFIRKARDRGDPLVAAGDRMRGRVPSEEQDAAGDHRVPGVATEPARAYDVHAIARNLVLDQWAHTDFDYQAIAAETEVHIDTVYDLIRQGKDKGDPRFEAGFARRDILAGRGREREPPAAAPAEHDGDVGNGTVIEIPERDPTPIEAERERIDRIQERIDRLDGMQSALQEAAEAVVEPPPRPALGADRQKRATGGAPTKAERSVMLWSTTDWSIEAIASEIGSTIGSVAHYLRTARRAGDDRVGAGDALRIGVKPQAEGTELNSPLGATEATMVVDGAGDDGATAPLSNSSSIPPAGEDGEASRGRAAPDVLPDGASKRPRSRVRIPPGYSVAFEGAPVAQSGRAGRYGDAGSNPVRASIGKPGSSADRAPSISPEGAHDGRGFESRHDEAGAPASPCSAAVAQAGEVAPPPQVSPEGASEVASELEVASPAHEFADSPAPQPESPAPADEGTVSRASGSAERPARPGSRSDVAEAAPALPDDQAVAIAAGWIVGPAGTIKGFPLVNAVLQVLAGGALVGVTVIAERAGARSAAAVQAILSQWRGDLERIGVEIVHFGDSIRLRRAGAQ